MPHARAVVAQPSLLHMHGLLFLQAMLACTSMTLTATLLPAALNATQHTWLLLKGEGST